MEIFINEEGYFDDWESFDYSIFNQFRSRRLSGTDPPAPAQHTSGSSSSSSMKVALTEAELFRRGIKRDAAAYPILKNEKSFTTWIRGMKAEMKAQGVANICEKGYVEPTTDEELKMDRLKQDFLYIFLIFLCRKFHKLDFFKGHNEDIHFR